MRIYISLVRPRIFPIDLQQSDSVLQIKQRIQTQQSIPLDSQRLVYRENQLQDEYNWKFYNFQQNSIVYLFLKTQPFSVQVFVKTLQGRQIIVQAQPTDTILKLKQKLQDKDGITYKRFSLIRGAYELQDNKTTIQQNLHLAPFIFLIYKQVQGGSILQLKTLTGKFFSIIVTQEDSVLDWKRKIFQDQKIPILQQRLVYKGKVLKNSQQIIQNNLIEKNQNVYLLMKVRGGRREFR